MKNIVMLSIIVCLTSLYGVFANLSTSSVPYPELFDEVCRLVEEHFYNPSFIQEKFPTIKKEYREKAELIATPTDFSRMVNAMLKHFDVSHTYYLTPRDYEYYHLSAVFSFLPSIQTLFDHQEILYPTVGIITVIIEQKVFIAAVLAGSAAEQAGLLSGDEIIDVNGTSYQPIDSLKDSVGTPVMFTVKRHAHAEVQRIAVTPVRMNPKTEMLEAQKASIRVIETQGSKIGYIHIYSYAGEEYHNELVSAISWGIFQEADALIIDLRYGVGGADPSYLNIFNPKIPVISSVDNTGKTYRYDPQWRKPAVFLVNGATRSGKEILAFGAQKYQLATVIGERTAGATLGATLFSVSNGDLLYLAGRRGYIDGVDLEGIGVTPDIEVPMDIRYCAGKDVQLARAIDYLGEVVQSQRNVVK